MMGGESELRSHNLWEWEPFPAQFRMKELNYNATNVPVGMGTVPRSVPNERTEGSLLGRASLIYMYPTSFVQEWTLTCPQYRPHVLRLTAYYAQQRVLCVTRTRVLKAVDEDKEIGNNRQ
jgi:hypothetical protein